MRVPRQVALAAIALGSLGGVLSGALSEQPAGSSGGSDGGKLLLAVMFFCGPLLVMAGVLALAHARYAVGALRSRVLEQIRAQEAGWLQPAQWPYPAPPAQPAWAQPAQPTSVQPAWTQVNQRRGRQWRQSLPDPLDTAPPVVRWTRVAGWVLVAVGFAALPTLGGAILGSIRLEGDAECDDWCGLGTALLAVFSGLLAATGVAGGAALLSLARWAVRSHGREKVLWWLPAGLVGGLLLWLVTLVVIGGV
ncbi:MAG TPA: hypothetical protein VEZ46_06495 [Mycobacteriales bacterium]|jgi:hypothetical protein|nr:hypothetical protein [Mycobacteriales bacterium]